MMDYRKKLNEMKVPELRITAGKLMIAGAGKLKKDELLKAILESPEEKIKKALGLDWWQKHKKAVLYLGLFGGIASIIALLFAFWSHQQSQEATRSVTERLSSVESTLKSKIADPAAVRKVKEEYEKILAGMEKTLKDLKTGDKKTRDEALKAFREGDYSKARQLFEDIRKREKEKAAFATYKLGSIAFLELDFKGALTYYLEAERLDPDNTLYQNEVGFIYNTLGKYKKAITYYEKALTSDLKTDGPQHPDVAIYRNNLGGAYSSLGQYEKAITYYEKALTSDLKTYGPQHPDVAIDRNNLGSAYDSLGQYDKAITYYEKALTSDLKTYGPQHPDVAIDRNNLGSAYSSLGQYKKAIAYYEKALKTFETFLGKDHPSTKTVRENLEFTRKKLK
jgi:tetratricopeptide (TPR) repeat protein